MNVFIWIFGFLVVGFVLALLFGKMARVGAGEQEQADLVQPSSQETAATLYEGRM